MKDRKNKAAVGRKRTARKTGGVNFRMVGALLRKGREERRSMFKAGQFDLLGFLLRVLLAGAIVALFVVFFGRFVGVYAP